MQKWEYGISSNMSREISFLLGFILLYSHSSHAGFLYAKTSLRRHWNGKDGMWSSKMKLRIYFTQDNLLSFNNITTGMDCIQIVWRPTDYKFSLEIYIEMLFTYNFDFIFQCVVTPLQVQSFCMVTAYVWYIPKTTCIIS